MIVNPQIISYKIITASLIVIISLGSVFGFRAYQSNSTEKSLLAQEKNLVEKELTQMILRYDQLNQTKDKLSERLDSVRQNAISNSEKFQLMQSDFSVYAQVKSELSEIKSDNIALFKIIDSISIQNTRLITETKMTQLSLNEQEKANQSLIKTNKTLTGTLAKEAQLSANSFQAKAYKMGAEIPTKKASHANFFNICFTLAENTLTEKGLKEIYIQILNPLNNVIGTKGEVHFGKSLLVYSDKQLITYDNKMMDICTSINAERNDIPFPKGTYYVSVFHKDRKLGSTQIILN